MDINKDLEFPCQLSKYTLLKKLGQGAFSKVFLGVNNQTNEKFAIKTLLLDGSDTSFQQKEKHLELFRNEVDRLKNLDHPNILKFIESEEIAQLQSLNGATSIVSYIVLEHAEYGEIFFFVSQKEFVEKTARFYYHQLISGLDYINRKGLVHRDLKLDNLLVDKDFNLKIGDFGFSNSVGGRLGGGYHFTKCGTKAYMAPEILHEHPYNAVASDIFSCGVILFLFLSKHPPFSKAKDDALYNKLLTNSDKFWNINTRNKKNQDSFYSEEFKELFMFMVNVDPFVRPSIAEIKCHPWFTGEKATYQEIYQEFSLRVAALKSQKQRRIINQKVPLAEENKFSYKTADTSRRERSRSREITERRRNTRGLKEDIQESGPKIEKYQPGMSCNTEIFTNEDPDSIFKAILKWCDKEEYQFEDYADQYKIDVCYNMEGDDGVKVQLKILEVDEGTYCIEFTLLEGDNMAFYEIYNNFDDYL